MGRTIVQLTPAQQDGLKRRAKERKISIAELIRQAVDASLEAPTEDEALRQRALSVGGRFNSGTGDLVDKHNEYFAESAVEH
jgi:hypothetical protein